MDYNLILLCLTVTTILLSSSSTSSASLLTDKEALLSLKSQITSDPSNALSSWTAQNMRVCNWTGVICSKNRQRVVGLDLDGLGLSGTISPQIFNLSFLHTLNLPNNRFSGILPDQIGDLLSLRTLNLSSNSIQGSIPRSITKCSNLIVLDLQGNELSGDIPMDIGATPNQLSKLKVFRLSQNQISGIIPPSMGNLSLLTNLDLGTNSIGGTIPSDLGRLQNLKELRLSINNLTGTVPSSFYNISSLVYFSVSSNNLWGQIPSDIGEKLPNLLEFNICINKFTGGIPESLHNLPNIQVIRMQHNLLTGSIPPGLGNLPKLRFYNIGNNRIESSGDTGLNYIINSLSNTQLDFLSLEENLLEGLIPESVGNLPPTLTKLYLGGNRIYGKIPSSISRLSNLGLLNLSHNSISGEIPPELGRLVNLVMLSLAGNKISGEIPDSLGNLRKLSKLELSGNELEGRIPTTLGNLEKLISLDLSRNKFNGSIPSEVFNLSTLSTLLNFSTNSFAGPLPSEIGYLKKLVKFDLSHNGFSGSIPESIKDCKSLQELFMSDNSLSGPIPATLGAVQGLETLDISLNQLSGSIPQELQNPRALRFMNLSFNNLEGRLPTTGVFKNLSRVDVQGNSKLCVSSNSSKWCEIHKKRSIAAARVIVTIVASTGLSVMLVSLVCIVFMYKRKEWFIKKLNRGDSSSSDEELYKGNHQMVSYEELRRATGNFDRENMVGNGSFGSVYKGIIWEGIAVAIKVLNLAQLGASKSFSAECEALRNVRHRNLVKLITTCSSVDFNNSDFRALVYEFLSKGSLEDWIRGRKRHNISNGDDGGDGMNTLERLNVVIDVASALDYLHYDCEVPVVHCDIKPSNVILDEDLTAKVGDFGLARILVEQSTTTSTYGLKGSIGYIPPEYGVGGKPSTRGDVYSYGVLLLELFTGRSPTDEGFKEGISLAKWVQSAFPCNITEIIEPKLLLLMGGSDHQVISPQAEQECWVSIMGVGLSCVADSPEARLTIREALHKLKFIREYLQKPPTDQSKISSM